MFEYIAQGWELIGNFQCLSAMLGGIIIGMIFGVIPGLTTNMCLAIMLPISYALAAMQAISLLLGIYIG